MTQTLAPRLSDQNDASQDYLAYRQTASAEDSIAAMRARVAARTAGAAAPAAAEPPSAAASEPPAKPSPVPMSSAAGALATAAGAVAKDLGRGVIEAPRQALGGVSDMLNRTFRAADDLAQWLNDNVLDTRYGDDTSFNPLRAAAGPSDPAARGFPEATSVTGGLVREASRFLSLFAPASRLLAPAGAGTVATSTAAGAVSDFLGADPDGERLADFWKKAGLPENVLTDYLAQDATDSDAEKRFKNALEGTGIGLLAEGLFKAAGAVRAGLKVRAFEKGGADKGAATPDPLAAAKAEFGSVGERDFLLLGDPDQPLLTVTRGPLAGDAADPQAKLNAAMAATETGVPTHVAARGIAEAAGGSAKNASAAKSVIDIAPEQRAPLAERLTAAWRQFRNKGPKPGENSEIEIGPVSAAGAARIKEAAQAEGVDLDVSGYVHTADAFAARHAAKHHSDAATEAARGQIALTEADWASIPDILAAPDRVLYIGKTDIGRDAIGYYKQVNGHVLYVEEVRTGQKTLSATSMRKMKGKLEEVAPGRSDAPSGPRDQSSETLPSAASDVAQPRIEINFARIAAPDDIKQVIDDMAQAFAPDIDQARRGVQSNEATQELADQLGLSVNDLLQRRQGQPLNAEQGLAARRLLNASAEKLLQVAEAAAAPTASSVDQYQFRKMMALHYAIQAEVIAARTETARALQAWSIPAGVGDVERSKAIGDMLANMGGPDLSQAMAKRLAMLKANGVPPEGISAFVRKGFGAATMDAVRESFVMGLLWSPTTHIVNTTSNLVVGLQQIQERALAGAFAELRGAENSVAPGEAVAMTYGLVTGLKDAFRLAGQAVKSGQSISVAGKVDLPREPALTAAAFNLDQAGAVGRVVDFAGAVTRIPGHLLAGQDAFFQSVGYRIELHARAWRQAASEGLEGKDAGRRMAEIVANPPEDLRMAAADAAAYATFTNETGGFAKKIMALRNHTGGDETALANLNPLFILLPFVKTPANVLSYTFARSPIAPLVGQWRADMAAGGARADLAMARVATGSAVMLLAADWASSGVATGAGPKDPGEREALQRQGWQPYSLKIGDTYYGYNRLDPFGMLMGFSTTMNELAHRGEIDPDDMDEWNEVVAGAIAAVSQTVVDKTFFTGVAQVAEVLGDPQRYTADYVNQLLGSFVPFTSALGFAERALDPATREVNGPWDAVLAKIPGLSENLTPRRNLWGEIQQPQAVFGATFDALSPVKVSRDKTAEGLVGIDAEMQRLNMDVRRIPKKTHLGGADVNLREFPEAYDALVRLAGNELKHPAWGLGLKDYLDAVVSGTHEMSAVYRLGSDGKDGGKAEFVKSAIREYRNLAAQAVLADPKFADLADLVGEKKTKRAQARTPNLE